MRKRPLGGEHTLQPLCSVLITLKLLIKIENHYVYNMQNKIQGIRLDNNIPQQSKNHFASYLVLLS